MVGIKLPGTDAAIPHGTYYWSCSAFNFIARDIGGVPGDIFSYGVTISEIEADEDSIYFMAPVFLPHGAVVTEVIVNGNAGASAETWSLYRALRTNGTGVLMATARINTADSSITNATIDNENYVYWLSTTTLDDNDNLYGARIIYTL